MRDVNCLQRCVIYVALWLRELLQDIRESRYVPKGADDPYWQHTMEILAAPVRKERLYREALEASGEHPVVVVVEGQVVAATVPPGRPSLAVPVVTHTGAVTAVMPAATLQELEGPTVHLPNRRPPSKRNHRKLSHVRVSVPQMTKASSNLDRVVDEVLAALGLSPAETRAILREHQQESVVARVLATV